jgi:hypothetical protein
MQTQFQEDVESKFAKLVERRGFRTLAGGYDAESFGNALVVLESEDYSIRLVRDRGQVFVELASPVDPGNWHGLGRVLAALHGEPEEERVWSGSVNLADAVSVIDVNHESLAESLGPRRYERTRVELERLGRLAKERLLGGFNRSKSE